MQSVLVSANRWRRPGCIALALALVLAAARPAGLPNRRRRNIAARRNFLQRLFLGNDYPEPPRQLRKVKPRKKVAKARPFASATSTPPRPRCAEVVEGCPTPASCWSSAISWAPGWPRGWPRPSPRSPSVTVLDRTNGSSGFVRDDHFDWPERDRADDRRRASRRRWSIMLGSNDRQQMRIGDDARGEAHRGLEQGIRGARRPSSPPPWPTRRCRFCGSACRLSSRPR